MSRIVNDPTIGPFEWDEELRYWRGSLSLPAGSVTHLDIAPTTMPSGPTPPNCSRPPNPVAAWLREAEIYAAGAGAMMPLYNGTQTFK